MKNIVRMALLTVSERVVLVHNHPSNSLIPSKEDIYLTNYTSKILKIFNIKDYTNTELKALLKKDNILEEYYDEWSKVDGNFNEFLDYAVEKRIAIIVNDFKEIEEEMTKKVLILKRNKSYVMRLVISNSILYYFHIMLLSSLFYLLRYFNYQHF